MWIMLHNNHLNKYLETFENTTLSCQMLWGVLYITEGLVVMLIYVSRDLSCIYIKALNVTQLLL